MRAHLVAALIFVAQLLRGTEAAVLSGPRLTLAVHDAALVIAHRNEGGGNFSTLRRE